MIGKSDEIPVADGLGNGTVVASCMILVPTMNVLSLSVAVAIMENIGLVEVVGFDVMTGWLNVVDTVVLVIITTELDDISDVVLVGSSVSDGVKVLCVKLGDPVVETLVAGAVELPELNPGPVVKRVIEVLELATIEVLVPELLELVDISEVGMLLLVDVGRLLVDTVLTPVPLGIPVGRLMVLFPGINVGMTVARDD